MNLSKSDLAAELINMAKVDQSRRKTGEKTGIWDRAIDIENTARMKHINNDEIDIANVAYLEDAKNIDQRRKKMGLNSFAKYKSQIREARARTDAKQ